MHIFWQRRNENIHVFEKKVVEHKMDKSKINETTQSRRRFVKRTAVGAAFVSLPVKSVWANGITNSIVASGHGSDWANGGTLRLQGPDYWASNITLVPSERFVDVFGETGYNSRANQGIRYKEDRSVKKIGASRTLADVLLLKNNKKTAGNAPWVAGPSDYNRLMVAMYLNAKYGNTPVGSDVHYPVANGRPFNDEYEYALKLAELTFADPVNSATELAGIIANPSNYQSL
ncbi:hypothetical protein BM528_12925 [Alteromonas sp. RW2A1]|nr:hypothetical protein BM528_12925 [Alteromonas sp. RW2A1]